MNIKFDLASFKPDSLVEIIQRTINASQLPSDYIVNVKRMRKQSNGFRYRLAETEQTLYHVEVVNSMGCYSINISFQSQTTFLGCRNYVHCRDRTVLLVVAFAGVRHNKRNLPTKKRRQQREDNIPIGNIGF